ncbi:ABC transporter ATP-binding protein [Qingshengfaniella alkalisoli]|uniref:ATP-binding cassette domain-containing protein n=1 Tax=Qingshengfaniella alkalisoli TaxID=2599296 RepID=A0A5B8IZZ0_9RHOB|nr:oligopeptide/dipeptide ABC transporter ATP-binding protein [Qingshengfaniella alkalisoli]QDY70511.1 ATP-binding cassette domain-containing protein [Qingshengfaniella alkalisoli]
MTTPDSPYLELKDLSLEFTLPTPMSERIMKLRGPQKLQALKGIDLAIPKGETLALVGESGCGKSSLARVLSGIYEPNSGQILFEGVDVNKASNAARRIMRQKFQMIFQDPYSSLNPRWTIQSIVEEPMILFNLVSGGKKARRARVISLLEQVGLGEGDLAKFPHEFSGGQRQRISIARALASEPEFLICDEPTSALDVSIQAQVLNLMKDLQKQYNLTCLFISHDLSVVSHIADKIGVMYLGEIIEMGTVDDIFTSPSHPYTRMLINAIPGATNLGMELQGVADVAVDGELPNPLNPPSGCNFHPRCAFKLDICDQEEPALVGVGGEAGTDHFAACHLCERYNGRATDQSLQAS